MAVGAPLVRMGWRPPGLSVPLPPLSSPTPQKSRRMMACNNNCAYNPVGAPTCLRKQEVGKLSLNAAQPYAKTEGYLFNRGKKQKECANDLNDSECQNEIFRMAKQMINER